MRFYDSSSDKNGEGQRYLLLPFNYFRHEEGEREDISTYFRNERLEKSREEESIIYNHGSKRVRERDGTREAGGAAHDKFANSETSRSVKGELENLIKRKRLIVRISNQRAPASLLDQPRLILRLDGEERGQGHHGSFSWCS